MEKKYVSVITDGELYGIDIMLIDSIVRMLPITRIPGSQDYFPGVINLRGEVVPVLSLRKRFGLEEAAYGNRTRIIILKPDASDKVGIIVDEVREVLQIADEDIDMINDSGDRNRFSSGIARTEAGLVSLLKIGAVLSGE